MYIFTHTRTSTYKNININWQAQIHSYIQVYNVYIHIYIYISICVCTNIYNKQFVYISMDDIKSSSVFFFLPVRFPLYLPPVLGSDFFPPLSFLSLQKGAEHWIAAQFTCPRWGLYRGMQASKRGREREREGGGGCVAASLQHLSSERHSQSTCSMAISSSTTRCFSGCS